MENESIKMYLIKHSRGYELDATRCEEAYQYIVSLEAEIARLNVEKENLLERLKVSEVDRFDQRINKGVKVSFGRIY